METLWSIFGLMFFLMMVLGFLYLVGWLEKGRQAEKIRAAFEWVFIKVGFVKVNDKAGG